MEYRTRKLIKHEDLNPSGTLFGGRALEMCDEEMAIFVSCVLNNPKHVVTKFMSAINFKAPAHLGDIIEIGTNLIKFGTTSVTISCSLRNKTTLQEILTIDECVFVNLDENGKPLAHGYGQHSIQNEIF